MWYWEVAAELVNGERYVNLDRLAVCRDPIEGGFVDPKGNMELCRIFTVYLVTGTQGRIQGSIKWNKVGPVCPPGPTWLKGRHHRVPEAERQA